MASVQSIESANVMSELYFEYLKGFDLMKALNEVPFQIQQRRTGFSPAARCLSLLSSQAQRCLRLTDWTAAIRDDSRLCHWLGGRRGPHPSTLSRTLAATDRATVEVLQEKVLFPLGLQALYRAEANTRWVLVDIDNKGIPAEGNEYEGTAYGRMPEGTQRRGYRLHLLSLGNRWPLAMEWTAANEHAAPTGMVMIKKFLHRLPSEIRRHIILRGDGNHGGVQFIRFLHRYPCGYLLRGYSSASARKLWQNARGPRHRVSRPEKVDLEAVDLGPTVLSGLTRKRLPDGRQRREACTVHVERVVVYQEDPAQVPQGRIPECFFLATTLPASQYSPQRLLREAYDERSGDVENIFCQLDQAFEITHLRCRSSFGNYTFVMLALVATHLTQLVREDCRLHERPIPPGMKETLLAAAACGLRVIQEPQAACVLEVTTTAQYAESFEASLRCSYQQRFKYAA